MQRKQKGLRCRRLFLFFFSRALHILDYVLGIKPVFKASSAYFRKGLALFGVLQRAFCVWRLLARRRIRYPVL
ncbi:hypothetical protein LI328DRAFT_119199 [Trichoderma asperelloides]|nr:hypothetical protein LI328DRAFT_119199 [Trichoderma asperelloides]